MPPRSATEMNKLLTISAMAILLSTALGKEPKPLILYRIGDVPVEMRDGDEYGVMLVNDGGEEDPRPRYILAIAKSRTVVDTRDLDLFRSLLGEVPKGATIFSYDSCTMPRSWGLKDEQFEAYDSVFRDLGLTLSEEQRTTCYCESVAK